VVQKWECPIKNGVYVIPHFATPNVNVEPAGHNSTICNKSPIRTYFMESDESGWLPMFGTAGIIMGIAMVPIWTIAFSAVEDQSHI